MAVSGTDLLWGCPQMNFKANPPFNEMRQGFATFKKETRMAQYLSVLFDNLPLSSYPRKRVSRNFEIRIPTRVAKMDRSKLAV